MPETAGNRVIASIVVPVVVALAVCAVAAVPASAQTPNESRALFRMVREPIAGGGELLTVFGRLDPAAPDDRPLDVPLVSVLRDTLGDGDRENDRLRYVWVHGYTSPSASQRLASAVPFFNQRAGNKSVTTVTSLPPSVLDLGTPTRNLWRTAIWTGAQYAFFDPLGVLVKSSVRALRRNDDDYRKAYLIRALAILALYDDVSTDGTSVLSTQELHDVQARLVLAQKTLGGIVDDGYLERVHTRNTADTLDVRGHNWELLRQRAEAEGLYFDPLTMPDGSATHALLWVARADVETARKFNSRFLNIKSPWRDKRLRQWTGFTETQTVDADGALVSPDTPGAREAEMIPLALYGLDHPKIPVVLIDFRDNGNPKRREVSQRVLHDITRNILSLSPYGDLEYLAGRSVYNFVTGRRGMDVNQPSRLRSYSQLKLMLALNATIDPALASEASRLLERVSMNPLQNDLEVERALAEQSYQALLESLRSPSGGLPGMLQQARRQEFATLKHGVTARAFLRTATIASLGLYRHREPEPAGTQEERLDVARRLAFHERFLKEVLSSTPVVEVTSNIDDVRQSIRYLLEHADVTDESIARLATRLFTRTGDASTRRLALDCLARIETDSARRSLVAIARDPRESDAWRAAARRYLFLPEAADVTAEGKSTTPQAPPAHQ
jgi:hypothetical protein